MVKIDFYREFFEYVLHNEFENIRWSQYLDRNIDHHQHIRDTETFAQCHMFDYSLTNPTIHHLRRRRRMLLLRIVFFVHSHHGNAISNLVVAFLTDDKFEIVVLLYSCHISADIGSIVTTSTNMV